MPFSLPLALSKWWMFQMMLSALWYQIFLERTSPDKGRLRTVVSKTWRCFRFVWGRKYSLAANVTPLISSDATMMGLAMPIRATPLAFMAVISLFLERMEKVSMVARSTAKGATWKTMKGSL